MTEGNEDLICRCGRHSARFREAKGKRAKAWVVFEVQEAGKQPRPTTTRAEKQRAWQAVVDKCTGQYVAPRPRATPAPAADRELRHSTSLLVDYKQTETHSTKPAGPG
jgi:hypothetical protein